MKMAHNEIQKNPRNIFDWIAQEFEKETGLSKEFVKTHSIWEIEAALGIPHYTIRSYYISYRTLKCGCRVPVKIYPKSTGHW